MNKFFAIERFYYETITTKDGTEQRAITNYLDSDYQWITMRTGFSPTESQLWTENQLARINIELTRNYEKINNGEKLTFTDAADDVITNVVCSIINTDDWMDCVSFENAKYNTVGFICFGDLSITDRYDDWSVLTSLQKDKLHYYSWDRKSNLAKCKPINDLVNDAGALITTLGHRTEGNNYPVTSKNGLRYLACNFTNEMYNNVFLRSFSSLLTDSVA